MATIFMQILNCMSLTPSFPLGSQHQQSSFKLVSPLFLLLVIQNLVSLCLQFGQSKTRDDVQDERDRLMPQSIILNFRIVCHNTTRFLRIEVLVLLPSLICLREGYFLELNKSNIMLEDTSSIFI